MMYVILKGTQMVSALIEWVMSSKDFIFTRLKEIKSRKILPFCSSLWLLDPCFRAYRYKYCGREKRRDKFYYLVL